MPNYNKSPFTAAVHLLYSGVAEWLFGALSQTTSPTHMQISSTALAANVATLGVTVDGGNAPAVGALISVQGTQTGGGEFNVTNVALSAVTLNSAGVGTVQFALVGANQATTPDAGVALVPIPVSFEPIVNNQASAPVAVSNNSFGGDLNSTLSVQAIFGTLPTAVTVTLQGAMVDVDADYVNIGVIATVAASAVTANGLSLVSNFLFVRAIISGLTGAGTIAVAIEA